MPWSLQSKKKMLKSDIAFIDFDNIDIRNIKYLPSYFDGDLCFSYPLRHIEFQVSMASQWMAWTRCATVTLGVPPKLWISKTILAYHFGALLVHFQCHNDYCDYIHRNGGVRNNTEWAGSIPLPFVVGNVAPTRSTLECKVCHSIPICIVLCHVQIIYIHSTSVGMSRACIHLNVHDHAVANDTWCKSLDMAYQCVANEVLKTPTT